MKNQFRLAVYPTCDAYGEDISDPDAHKIVTDLHGLPDAVETLFKTWGHVPFTVEPEELER